MTSLLTGKPPRTSPVRDRGKAARKGGGQGGVPSGLLVVLAILAGLLTSLACRPKDSPRDPIDVSHTCLRDLVVGQGDQVFAGDTRFAFLGTVGNEFLDCLRNGLSSSSDVRRAEDCFDNYRSESTYLLGCLDRQLIGLPYSPPEPPASLSPEQCRTDSACSGPYSDCLANVSLPPPMGPTREDEELCAASASRELQ